MAKSVVNHAGIRPFVTHDGDWDTLLVRIGHYLYFKWKKTQSLEDEEALQAVWAAKEAYRAPIRASIKANQEAFAARVRAKAKGA